MTINSEPSSGSTAPEVTQATADPQIDAKASPEPSPEQKGEGAKPESLLDAVKSVFEPDKDKAKSPDAKDTNAQNSETDPKAAETDDGSPKKTEEDDRLDKHPRFKEVISERNKFREEVTQLREANQDYERIQSFMKTHNLSVDDTAKGWHIMAAMQNNPAEALKMLQPYVDNLRRFVGDQLPDDLAQRVQDGFIDAETAKELAFRRNNEVFARNQQQRQQETQAETQQRQQAEFAQRNQLEMGQAVTTWEEGIKARDVDYSAKAKLVETQYRVLLQNFPPRNQQEAVALAEKAYAEVNEQTRAFRTAKPPVRAPRTTISSPSAAPAPKSLKEAIALSVRR